MSLRKKSKDSPALFEVVARNRQEHRGGGLFIPAWMQKRRQAPPVGAEKVGVAAADAPAAHPQPAGPQASAVAKAAKEALVWLSEGRIRFSLNYISCLAVSWGLALILAAAFWLGLSTGAARRADVAAANPPGASQMGAPQGASNAELGDDASLSQRRAKPVSRTPGKFYLVIQQMNGLSSALQTRAEQITEYCTKQGEPASVAKTDSQYVVWSQKGFDSPTDKQAVQYAKAIHNLGKKYKTQHGGPFDFSQEDAQGKSTAWFAEPGKAQ